MADKQLIHRGVTFDVNHIHDDTAHAPWDNGDDGRGVVVELTRDPDGADDLDVAAYRHMAGRYHFDQAATLAKALEEQWGLSDKDRHALAVRLGHDPSPEEIATEATENEYKFLRGWARDDWEYIGVLVSIPETALRASLWGIESNAGVYLDEVARELADQILDEDLEGAYQLIEKIAAAAGVKLDGI